MFMLLEMTPAGTVFIMADDDRDECVSQMNDHAERAQPETWFAIVAVEAFKSVD